MALYTPKNVVLNWYRYDVSFSLELMSAFVQGVEKQVLESISTYRAKRTEEGHQGLDDSWDLDLIFVEHFPNLQRRSAFMALWSFLESELDKLCSHYRAEKGFKLAVSDLSDRGIDRSTSYLEKVAGLEGLKTSQEWNELKTLQRIRNVIAHDDGKIQDRLGKPKDGLLKDMRALGFLKGEEVIVIEGGFLSQTVAVCKRYFELIDKVVEIKEASARVL